MKTLLTTFSVVLIAVVAVISFALLLATPVQSDAGPVVEYDINENGLTYGSALDAPSLEVEPDLIEAYATNGSIGYVYKEDLEQAANPYPPKNPEEAVQLMNNRFMAASIDFAESVKNQTGFELSVDMVNEILSVIFETNGEMPFDLLTDIEKQSIIQLIPENDNAVEIASNAYTTACQANDRSIPVYESDGVTVIGEFVVS
jgi:hypothetical protein